MTRSPIAAPPPCGTPSDAKASLIQAAYSDFFAVAYVQLCVLSYQKPAEIPAMVANPKFVQPWGEGSWSCTWGPALDPSGANLVYVATYTDRATRLPVASVVVTRGTNITSDAWSDLVQAFEDLMVLWQQPLPWLSDPSVVVAEGTLYALAAIENLQSGGVGLRNYLAGFLGNPANQRPVLVLTGHSLGGCLTTVAAPWLQSSLAQVGVKVPVVPVTFAAPTAGNNGFANYFQQCFSYAPRYVNSLDLVPLAWSDLEGMKSLYDPCQISTPLAARLVLDSTMSAMSIARVSYRQPSQTAVLNAACAPGVDDWYTEVGLQHHATTYLSLMTGSSELPRIELRPRTPRDSGARAALTVPPAR
jgi:hypothetical protein